MAIDMYITSSNLNTSWYATSIYGYPYCNTPIFNISLLVLL